MNERNTGIEHMNMQEFRCGLKDGAPIAAGYLSVSFSFGIMVLGGGLSIFQGALMSLTNMTSAGQFAGLQVIIAGGHASGDGGDPVHYQSEIRADESVALAEAVRCGDVPGTAGHRVREY